MVISKYCKEAYLSNHGNGHEDDELQSIVQTAEAADQARPHVGALGVRRRVDEEAVFGVLLLHLRDMQEVTVGGVEQGEATGQIDAHDPELHVAGHDGADHDGNLAGNPVQMKKTDSRKRERERADSQDGVVAALDQIEHASSDDYSPDGGPDIPPDGHRAVDSLGLGVFVNTEFGPHCVLLLLVVVVVLLLKDCG